MSVLTILLLLATCHSMLADGAPNEKDHESFQLPSHLRPRDIFPNSVKDTHYPGLNASGSSRVPLSNNSVTGSGCFLMPSGTVNTGSSFGTSSIVPYPTEGAPYRNSTSLYPKLGNGEGKNGQSGRGNQCSPQETVTLPPQTITLPAQTVTMTLAPETITITQVQTETTTVTVTAQTQTTTVTVWMTVTAPSCPSPSNAASPQIPPVPALITQPSNTPLAPVSDNASTPVVIPPPVTTSSHMIPSSTGNAVPIANATSPASPNLGPTTAAGPTTFPGNDQVISVAQQTSSSLVFSTFKYAPKIAPYPYRNTTNQTLPFGSGSSTGFRPTGSGIAKSTNIHLSSFFVSKFVTDTPISTTTVGPSPTEEYFLGNGSSLLVPPPQANATVFQLTGRPTAPPFPTREYFPDGGSSLLTPPAQANATTSPIREYFPDDGSSLLTPPTQANTTSVPLINVISAPVITPAVVGSSQTLAVALGSVTPPPPLPQIIQSNTSTSVLPLSTPITPPLAPILQPNTSTPRPASTSSSDPSDPPTTSTSPLCTNGTTAQNITQNFSEIPPIPTLPLILQGLNYTTFTPLTLTNPNSTSPLPPPTHLLARSSSQPKEISLAPNSLSFSLTSLSLSCADASLSSNVVTANNTNCAVQIVGAGVDGSGAESAVSVGEGMQTVLMGEGWAGLSLVRFSAEKGGVQMGVALGEMVYELVSGC